MFTQNKKFRAFLEQGQWSSVTLWTLMTVISYLALISWLIMQWGAVRDTVQRLPLTSGSLQLKTKVLIRKCSSCCTKNVVNADNFGEMAWEGRSLEMGQEMLLFPDPNLCPWTWWCFVLFRLFGFVSVCVSILAFKIWMIMVRTKGCDKVVINWYMWTTYNNRTSINNSSDR